MKKIYFTESEKSNMEFVNNAIEEISRYYSNWSFMTRREKQNIGGWTRKQLGEAIHELYEVKYGRR